MPLLEKANSRPDWAWIGLKEVSTTPGATVSRSLQGEKVIGIEEKPPNPKSAVRGGGHLHLPGGRVRVHQDSEAERAAGELEITDVNNHYIQQGRLGCFSLDGYWTDAGTLDSLDAANELVRKDPPRF